MMIGGHRLRGPVRALRGCTVAENGEGGLTIRGCSVAGCFHVAKDLVVGAVFLNDVDDVLDGVWSWKKSRGRESHKAVILQSLLGVSRELRQIGKRDPADVSCTNRAPLLPSLAI